ncbi:Allantoicase [Tilletia horrida]|nr:Allantoicase [Tilletia horrida]
MTAADEIAFEPVSLGDAATQLYSRSAEVSSVALGGHVLSTSDEWFAPASDLLKVAPAVSCKGQFGPAGAKFDGWETRRHNPLPQRYDWVILRLGPAAGAHVLGFDVDTANFNGNEAPEVEIHALRVAPQEESAQTPADIAEDDARWITLLPRTPCGPSQQHLFASTSRQPTQQAYTHIKLVMVPDGGIARFRVYGTIPPPPPFLGIGESQQQQQQQSPASAEAEAHLNTLDLAHVLNGGRVIFTSDQHFGVGSNLILPGRGKDMGDGWETKRSRSPTHKDWVVIQLAQRAYLTSAEIDTIHFLGNFPDSVELHALDLSQSASTAAEDLAKLGNVDERVAGWRSILPASKVGPGKQHFFDLQPEDRAGPRAVTHVRVTMHPDGGIKRVRLVGRRADLVDAASATSLPTVPLPTPATSSSHARAGLYPIPASYPVTGKSVFDSELRALLSGGGGGSGRDPSGTSTGAGAGAAAALSGATGSDQSIKIRAEPITREAYAPYGSLIAAPASSDDSDSTASKTVNQGTASKFLSLSPFLSLYPSAPAPAPARAHFHIYRSAARFPLGGADQPAEFAVKVLERHRFTTQAFLPLTADVGTQHGYLVIVALPLPSSSSSSDDDDDGAAVPEKDERRPDLATLRAFWATSTQAISYHPGIWHHPIVSLGTRATDFACVVHESEDRPELDCDEVFYEDEGTGGLRVAVVL